MLRLIVGEEFFDQTQNRFVRPEGTVLDLEHSLISLSKWESKHEIPFLTANEKTAEQILDYIQFMIISPGVNPEIVFQLNEEQLKEINRYIESKQSATTFNEMNQRKGRPEVITSELIYYWMVTFNIPLECENWHLNRLFSLLRICNLKNSKPKPMSKSEIAARNRELNAQRRAQLGTKG